ncbi:O-methyltransferase [Oribacterium sp. WCC10]|uniref:O-methyltransferase n=1 Tax=Oribacterium sp. WCC10 TaxID=1855343 RepID=UPI0008F0B9D0|nr:O-methyltransferase [Oribacterium sp. WCC10]SFG38787.1 Predicted O-methyltransferase YrrM [Oribacterium sp. WCC10]
MIANERLVNYIHSLEPDRSELLENVRKEALAAEIPIIRDETAALLKCFITMLRPKRILEIGTAVGYSALTMAHVMPLDAEIITVENYEPRVKTATRNISGSVYRDRIHLIDDDAGKIIREFAAEGRQFDFIFMDAAKAQYIVWLPDIIKMMPEGAVLFSDNILQDGSIVDSRYQIKRRDRTIHSRMREYLFELKHMEVLETSILTDGDGISISVKK